MTCYYLFATVVTDIVNLQLVLFLIQFFNLMSVFNILNILHSCKAIFLSLP